MQVVFSGITSDSVVIRILFHGMLRIMMNPETAIKNHIKIYYYNVLEVDREFGKKYRRRMKEMFLKKGLIPSVTGKYR